MTIIFASLVSIVVQVSMHFFPWNKFFKRHISRSAEYAVGAAIASVISVVICHGLDAIAESKDQRQHIDQLEALYKNENVQ